MSGAKRCRFTFDETVLQHETTDQPTVMSPTRFIVSPKTFSVLRTVENVRVAHVNTEIMYNALCAMRQLAGAQVEQDAYRRALVAVGAHHDCARVLRSATCLDERLCAAQTLQYMSRDAKNEIEMTKSVMFIDILCHALTTSPGPGRYETKTPRGSSHDLVKKAILSTISNLCAQRSSALSLVKFPGLLQLLIWEALHAPRVRKEVAIGALRNLAIEPENRHHVFSVELLEVLINEISSTNLARDNVFRNVLVLQELSLEPALAELMASNEALLKALLFRLDDRVNDSGVQGLALGTLANLIGCDPTRSYILLMASDRALRSLVFRLGMIVADEGGHCTWRLCDVVQPLSFLCRLPAIRARFRELGLVVTLCEALDLAVVQRDCPSIACVTMILRAYALDAQTQGVMYTDVTIQSRLAEARSFVQRLQISLSETVTTEDLGDHSPLSVAWIQKAEHEMNELMKLLSANDVFGSGWSKCAAVAA